MEPTPGTTILVSIFERAMGARLEVAERFVLSLPQLFSGALLECDLALQRRTGALVILMRFAESRFGADARRRLDFWCGRSGIRATLLAALSPSQRETFLGNIDRCELKEKAILAERLAAGSAAFFTEAGAPEGRRRAVGARPVLAMDVGGPGWQGVRWSASERVIFVPGTLAPPEGDELTLALRFPGNPKPVAVQARVLGARAAEAACAGATAGYALVLSQPPHAVTEGLERQAALLPEVAVGREQRAHPRFPVKAPVLVTPYEPDAAATGGAPPAAAEADRGDGEADGADGADEAGLGDEAGRTAVSIEWGSSEELAQDYVDNLSQGGAFIRTGSPLPVGTRLTLTMRLPSGEELGAPAAVASVSERGMGVKFELDAERQARLAAAIAHISARPRRALVVDDDAVVRLMLQDALRQRGFEVLLAADGATGLSILSEELLALDMLVTDVCMPNMDGEQFIRTIRRAGGESDLAIVVVTGVLEGGTEQRLEREGADAVLDKALGPELIAQAADAVLERKRLERGR
jgi:CheY-like chemotaxis protein